MTKQYKRIMLVINGSDDVAAIDHCLRLAKVNKASILVVKVIDNLTKVLEITNALMGRVFEIRQQIIADMKLKIESKIKKSESKIRITYKALEGATYAEITKNVIESKIDLLIISHAENKAKGAEALSSTDLNLLRKCPCAVWIAKPVTKEKLNGIMVSVDIDSDNKVKTKLNIDLMIKAIDLARSYKIPLHVLYVWHLYGENTLRDSPFVKIKKSELDSLLREMKKKSAALLDEFISKFDVSGVKLVPALVKGDPTTIIPKFVVKNKIKLVVMGTVCRVGIPGFFIGNTAEEILRNIHCSVLTIKPKGFVSPLAIE